MADPWMEWPPIRLRSGMPSPCPAIAEAIASVQSRVELAAHLGGHWVGGYAKSKIASDWIYPQLYERIEPGTRVLDLGAGVGLLGLLLAEKGQGCVVHGIEWDKRKVAFAQRLIAPESPCHVSQGDLLKESWPPAGVIVLVDVLHYFPESVQKDLLQRIAQHLEPGGTLFLRVMNRDAKGWARFTRLLETAAVVFRWNRAKAVHWRSLKEIQHDLVTFGLQPAICLSRSHLLDGNCLIAATKP